MSTVLEHSTEKQHFVLTCSIGIPHCFVSASYMRKLVEHELKLRLSAKYALIPGVYLSYGLMLHIFSELEHLDLLQSMGLRKKYRNTVL